MTVARAAVTRPVMGMALFIASEVLFFGALFAAYFSLRSAAGAWPPEGTPDIDRVAPALFTLVLVASSATQHRAAHVVGRDRRAAARWTAATVALGLLFLGGQGWEWYRLGRAGLSLATDVYGTLFFTLTGAHGLHVAGGLVMLGASGMALTGRRSPRPGVVDAVTLYWHFVDAVWLVLFATLYLPL